MRIEPGDIVVAVLQNPREKLFGILGELSPAGMTVRAIELGYFDDWCRSVAEGEVYLTMTEQFIPMWRVERITRDAAIGEVPSLEQQFKSRTGLALDELS